MGVGGSQAEEILGLKLEGYFRETFPPSLCLCNGRSELLDGELRVSCSSFSDNEVTTPVASLLFYPCPFLGSSLSTLLVLLSAGRGYVVPFDSPSPLPYFASKLLIFSRLRGYISVKSSLQKVYG